MDGHVQYRYELNMFNHIEFCNLWFGCEFNWITFRDIHLCLIDYQIITVLQFFLISFKCIRTYEFILANRTLTQLLNFVANFIIIILIDLFTQLIMNLITGSASVLPKSFKVFVLKTIKCESPIYSILKIEWYDKNSLSFIPDMVHYLNASLSRWDTVSIQFITYLNPYRRIDNIMLFLTCIPFH